MTPRLDPPAILRQAAIITLGNLPAYLRLAALPFAVSMACWLAAERMRDAAPGIAALVTLVALAAMVGPATAWHRFVMLGEAPRLRFGEAEWFYIWAAVKLSFAAWLPIILLAPALAALWQGGPEAIYLLLNILVSLLIAAFLLALPAAAVGRPIGILAAFRLLQGNFWRLASLELAIMAPSLGLGLALPGSSLAGLVAMAVLDYALLPLAAGVLSLAYVGLTPDQR